MGFALAEACAERGAEVTLIAGPVSLKTSHPLIKRINVESAQEMYDAAMMHFPDQNAGILCAAVADYRPETQAEQKLKRTGDDLVIRLTPNPDIAASLGRISNNKQVLVGFALETNDEVTNATGKLKRKNLDFIVLNSLQDAGAGFKGDTNKITILNNLGEKFVYPLKQKTEVAKDIVDMLVATMLKKDESEKI